MRELQEQIDLVKKRHRFLLSQSQNPHTDPLVKSVELAIVSLERKKLEGDFVGV